jgi:hypothetical protein
VGSLLAAQGRAAPRVAGSLWLALALASSTAAQTTDPLFAGWRFTPPSLGSRPGGMGGAFVAVADSVKAAFANPAGLTLIPISEIGVSSGRPWLGAGFGRQRFRVAGYVTQLDEARVDLAEAPPGASGSVESTQFETGLAAGVQLHPRVRLGASLAWTRLRLDGQRLVAADGGQQAIAASVDADEGQLHATAGLLVILVGANTRALPSVRLGIDYQPGFDWSARVTDGAGENEIVVRRPSLVSVGVAWRFTDRWSFAAQGDVIRYGEVVDALHRNVGATAAAGFTLPNAIEPRFGTEFAAPLWCGCGIVRLRGGLHYRSPGTLLYEGADPAAARAFSRQSWRTVATLGASIFAEHFGNALRLDLDSRNVLDGPELSFGIAWRF